MLTCVICGQADDRVQSLGGYERHIGMDACITSLKKQLEQARAQGSGSAPAPDRRWVQDWYAELAQAREVLVPQVLALAGELDVLNGRMHSTSERMKTIDTIIRNVENGIRLQEIYAQREQALLSQPAGLPGAGEFQYTPAGPQDPDVVLYVPRPSDSPYYVPRPSDSPYYVPRPSDSPYYDGDVYNTLEMVDEGPAPDTDEVDIPDPSDTAGIDDQARRGQ